MKLGITEHVDCAHHLPGHPRCGANHGHTYSVEVVVEGEPQQGMLIDFADLRAEVRAILRLYDHRDWNEFLEYPSVENICARLRGDLELRLRFPFTLRVHEGHGKWAEL